MDELIGMAADRRIEHLLRERVRRVVQRVGRIVEHETGRRHFLLHDFRIEVVQGAGGVDGRMSCSSVTRQSLNSALF